MIRDVLAPALVWWVVMAVVGWSTVPIAYRLLPVLPDRGLAFARPLGMLLAGYAFWVAVMAGVLPNSRIGAACVLIGLVALGAWAGRGVRAELLAWLRQRRRLVLGYEVLFLIALVACALYRSYVPTIEPAGGEKYMEMAFINAVLRSPTFPPNDPWLSGYAISYYYFGYVQAALLTWLTGLPSAVAFNLVIPMTLGMTLVAAFGLGHGLVALSPGSTRRMRVLGGAFTAWLTALAGSLIGAVELGYLRGWGPPAFYRFLAIRDLSPDGVCGTAGSGYANPDGGWLPPRFIWWWRGSRVIHDNCNEIIHEFPFFSYMLGDVHPHVVTMPYALLTLGLALAVLLGLLDGVSPRRLPWRLAPLALVVGALGFLNTWDLPTFGALVLVAFALRQWLRPAVAQAGGRVDLVAAALGGLGVLALAWRMVPTILRVVRGIPPASQPLLARASLSLALLLIVAAVAYSIWSRAAAGDAWARRTVAVGRFALWLVGLAVVCYLPFYIGFRSQAAGIGLVEVQSRPAQWLVHFGLPWFLGLTLAMVCWPKRPSSPRSGVRVALAGPMWLVLAVLGPVLLVGVALRAWMAGAITLTAMAASIAGLEAWRRARPDADDRPPGEAPRPVGVTFALGCVAVGMLLTLVTEFVFVRDLFNSRMNTIFKLYFQAWMLLSVGGGYAIYVVWRRLDRLATGVWTAGATVLVLASLVYPVAAVYDRTGGSHEETRLLDDVRTWPAFGGTAIRRMLAYPVTLDGLAVWATNYPDDLAAVEWLRENVTGAPVILEAYGGGYEHNGRISMATGLPTVLGWDLHENQWRGTREVIEPRKVDIQRIYAGSSEDEMLRLLDRYGVRFVVVGEAERTHMDFTVSAADEERYASILRPVFTTPSGRLTIYERP